MLGKLIKHEFKATARLFVPVFLVVFALSLAVRGLMEIIDYIVLKFSDTVEVISMVIVFIFIAALVASIICLVMSGPVISLYRFYKNVYTDEGYLTNTLPVTPGAILFSKLLAGFVWTIASAVVGIICFVVITINTEDMDIILEIVRVSILFEFITDNIGLVISFLVFGIISIIMAISSVYMSVSIGNLTNRHKVLLSLVVYFLLSNVLGIAIAVIMVIAGEDMLSSVTSVFVSRDTFELTGVYTAIVWIYSSVLFVISIAELIVTHFIMKRKLNLA